MSDVPLTLKFAFEAEASVSTRITVGSVVGGVRRIIVSCFRFRGHQV